MKQIKFNSFGPPFAVAACVDIPDLGEPAPWEVIVDVEVFPINVADIAILSGDYGNLPQLPASLGMEGVGTISNCGSRVMDLAVGDRVVILANNNWTEQRKVAISAVQKVSKDADLTQISLLKVNPATAYMLLNNFVTLEPEDWVIQSAPLSSVGQCVIQLAKAQGVKTVNIIHRPELRDEVKKRGGDVVIEDGTDLGERVRAAIGLEPIRIAFDAVAGEGVQRLADCLCDGGQVINYGILSGEPCVMAAEQTVFRGISLKGFWLSKILNRISKVERNNLFETLGSLIEYGELKIDIDSYYPISDIKSALHRAIERKKNGKVMVYTKYAPDQIKHTSLKAS